MTHRIDRGRQQLASKFAVVALLQLTSLAVPALPADVELTGPQIKAAFAGKVISEGAHWSAYLQPDGRTQSVELGRAHRGSWKVNGKELCVSISDGAQPECWTVMRKGSVYVLRAYGRDLYEVIPEPLSSKYAFDLPVAASASRSRKDSHAMEASLTGTQIRAAISGKYVTDDHHWGHKYFADGRVERFENGRQRSARWSIKSNRLCLLKPEISKDEPICYIVIRDGAVLQYRDDAQHVAFRGVVRPMPPPKP
jgi:hypothetical protein